MSFTPFSSVQVANFFIHLRSSTTTSPGSIILQKLVYFAHGWHLALTDLPLLTEEPEVWPLGPVFPELFQARKKLISEMKYSTLIDSSPEQVIKNFPQNEDLYNFLLSVNNRYKSYSAEQITALTHADNTPWDIITKKYSADGDEVPRGEPIPNSLIINYFKELYERAK